MTESNTTAVRNTLYLSAGKFAGDICVLAFLVYFARIFGVETLGKYAFSMALGGLLAFFINLGTNTLMAREVGRDIGKEKKYAGNIVVTQVILAFLVIAAIIVVGTIYDLDSQMRWMFFSLSLYQVFYRLTLLFRTRFRIYEAVRPVAVLEAGHKIFILAVGALIIHSYNDPVLAVAVYPISGFAMLLLFAYLSVIEHGWPNFRPDWQFVATMLRHSAPLFAILLMTTIFDRAGLLILTVMRGEAAAGLFSASDRLIITVLHPISVFGAVILPVLSRLSIDDNSGVRQFFENCIRFVFVTLLPIAAVLFLMAENVVTLIYGHDYKEATDVFRVLIWLIIVTGISTVASTVMIAIKQEYELLKRKLAVALIYIGMCIALVHYFSYFGLAIAKLSALTALAISYWTFVIFRVPSATGVVNIVAPLAACSIGVLVYYLVGDVNFVIRGTVTLISSYVCMYIFGAVQATDLRFVAAIFGRNTSANFKPSVDE